eukprot:898870-Rhodomonas_salina.2
MGMHCELWLDQCRSRAMPSIITVTRNRVPGYPPAGTRVQSSKAERSAPPPPTLVFIPPQQQEPSVFSIHTSQSMPSRLGYFFLRLRLSHVAVLSTMNGPMKMDHQG